MKISEGLQPLQQSLSGLPQWASARILQQINQLTHYEPVIGIMGKTGVGKSSLCNTLFAGEVSPVSDVAACTRKTFALRPATGEALNDHRGLTALVKVVNVMPNMPPYIAHSFPVSTWCYG